MLYNVSFCCSTSSTSCVCALVAQSCPTFCDSMDYSPPGSFVHGIFQARTLEQVPFPTQGDLPGLGIKSASLASPAEAGRFSTAGPPGLLGHKKEQNWVSWNTVLIVGPRVSHGEEMATHSSVLAWRIPRTGEPGGLPSMGLHRVGHDWSDLAAAESVTQTEVSQKEKNKYHLFTHVYGI